MPILRIGLLLSVLCLVALLFQTGTDLRAEDGGLYIDIRESDAPDAPIKERWRLYTASYALVIGIDDYTDGWQRLTNAVRDARELADELERHGFRVTLKTDLKADELGPTLKNFYVSRGADPSARLLLWFAGHGQTIDGETFLIPADAPLPGAPDFKLKALHLREIDGWVRLAKSKHVLSIFDACFAGTIFSSRSGPATATITKKTKHPVRQFITSGDAGQVVRDDGSFRKFFVGAINGDKPADANLDGYVTGDELGLYLSQSMEALTETAQTPRHGRLNDVKYQDGDFVFQLPAREDVFVQSAARTAPQEEPDRAAAAEHDLMFWKEISSSEDPSDYRAYLEVFPNGYFAHLAKTRAERLEGRPRERGAQEEEEDGRTLDELRYAEDSLSRDDKRRIQAALKTLGYYGGPTDAQIGRGTRSSIRAYQGAIGETQTGLLTGLQLDKLMTRAETPRVAALASVEPRQTIQSAEPASPSPAPTRRGDAAGLSTDQVRLVQSALRKLGYYDGPLDAAFDDETRRDITEFQDTIGGQRTGQLTPDQYAKLVKWAEPEVVAEMSADAMALSPPPTATVKPDPAPAVEPASRPEPEPEPEPEAVQVAKAEPVVSPSPTPRVSREEQFWEEIRASRDPGDFADYLQEFGKDAAHSREARARMRELRGSSRTTAALAASTTRSLGDDVTRGDNSAIVGDLISKDELQDATDAVLEAKRVIEELANKTGLSGESSNRELMESLLKLRGMLGQVVNFEIMARYVLGDYKNGISKADWEDFLLQYQELFLSGYKLPPPEEFTGTIEFEGVRPTKQNDIMVLVALGRQGQPATRLWFRVRRHPGALFGYMILDAYIDGVSILQVQRSEFNSTLRRVGVAGLTGELAAKYGAPLVFDAPVIE